MNADDTDPAVDLAPAAGRVIRPLPAAIEAAAREGGPAEPRIVKALNFAINGNGVDGEHHKAWAFDQIVRALCGVPMVTETANDYRGEPYSFETQGSNTLYEMLIDAACDGEDGPETYSWDEGIPA
jgi:hypothetical protein